MSCSVPPIRVALGTVLLVGLGCAPPAPENRDGSGGRALPISVLQQATDPDYPGAGAQVLVDNAIVTAVDTFDEDGKGHVGNTWIADPAGGPWSGIQLFAPVVIPSRVHLAPGDLVEATGTLDEFVLTNPDGTPQDANGTLTELSSASVQKIGETLPPAATTIPLSDLESLASAEPWEDCLVRVENVTLTGVYDRYGEAPITSSLKVADDLYHIPGVTAGMHLGALTGIVTYFFGFKIMPRGPEDVEP